MPTIEHLEGHWREWRYAHVATMFRPYGWTSLIAQHWLTSSDSGVEIEGLPGTWSVDDGVVFTPPASGSSLSVNGEYPTGPVRIITGRNQTYGHGQSVPVYYGRLEIETLPRTTHDGERIFGVRVRDPLTATLAHEAGLSEFDYDPSWRLPGVFTPFDRVDVEAETVEEGVRETTPHIGTFAFEYDGSTHEVVVLGKDTDAGTVQPVVHFRDGTNGTETYGAGRVVEIDFTGKDRIDWIDFNYAVALPCAFTNFVTCPLPPPQNALPFEVRAGEKKPEQGISRTID